jgi:hypothetical protein
VRHALYIAALAVAAGGCTHIQYQPELAAVLGVRRVNGEGSPGACLVVTQRVTERVGASYVHCSDPTAGKPFNEDYDVSDDVLGVTVTFGGHKR